MLMLYISTGVVFMLLPGTFLGVWNLLTISSHRAANSVSPAWIQAHGHAQIFGWIGSFVLGIGFYSIPKLRRMGSFALTPVWCAWGLWTSGVALRWLGSVYPWHWRVLVPLSSVCELTAFLVFFRIVSGHHAEDSGKTTLAKWVFVVIAGSLGLLLTLLVNVGLGFYLAFQSASPEVPANFDQRFLVLETWGCLVPFVWGQRQVATGLSWFAVRAWTDSTPSDCLKFRWSLARACWRDFACHAINPHRASHCHYCVTVVRTFRTSSQGEGSSRELSILRATRLPLGVDCSLSEPLGSVEPRSVRDLGGVASRSNSRLPGYDGVCHRRQLVLPAFSGMRLLFSTKLMFCSLLAVGCFLRVSSEVLAYQGVVRAAWLWLPTSAICEMAAVTVFAFNLLITFARQAPLPQRNLFAKQGNYAPTERVVSDVREQIKVLIILVLAALSRAQLFL